MRSIKQFARMIWLKIRRTFSREVRFFNRKNRENIGIQDVVFLIVVMSAIFWAASCFG